MLPEGLAGGLLWANNAIVYQPLRLALETTLRRHPPPFWITPNGVTTMSALLLVPTLAALHTGHPVLATGFVVLHDVLDRTDGALARASTVEHDREFGAYYDAMCDKVFQCGMLYYLLSMGYGAEMGPVWVLAAVGTMATQMAQGVIRTQDYIRVAHGEPETRISCFAVDEGKLSTFAGNLALASVPMAVFEVGGGLEKESAALFSTAVSILGLDMAIRSLASKLRSRAFRITSTTGKSQ